MRNFRVPGSYPEPDRSLTGVWDFLFRVSVRGSEFPVQGPVLCVISWFKVLSGTGQELGLGFRVLRIPCGRVFLGLGKGGLSPGRVLCVIPGFSGWSAGLQEF